MNSTLPWGGEDSIWMNQRSSYSITVNISCNSLGVNGFLFNYNLLIQRSVIIYCQQNILKSLTELGKLTEGRISTFKYKDVKPKKRAWYYRQVLVYHASANINIVKDIKEGRGRKATLLCLVTHSKHEDRTEMTMLFLTLVCHLLFCIIVDRKTPVCVVKLIQDYNIALLKLRVSIKQRVA